jgi:type IX secretion system PorP/SprF family membrane protein
MKRIILCILVLLSPFLLKGQMFPLSDHYLIDALDINPAFAGCHDALSTSLIFRDQWVGFSNSPKSYLLSVHAPVDNDKIGLGLVVEKNSIGIYKETSFIGNYAYRMELENGKLALGLGLGVTIYNTAWNELVAADAGDAQLSNTSERTVLPAVSLGTYYYTRKFYVGFSIPVLLGYETYKNSGKYKLGNNFSGSNYFITGGYEAEISRLVKFLPSILIKYHPGNAVQIDYNAQVSLKDKLWLGIGYRNSKTLVGMLQCQLNYQIRMAYSYDYCLGVVGKYMSGSHEIVLNYKFRYARTVMGPRYF